MDWKYEVKKLKRTQTKKFQKTTKKGESPQNRSISKQGTYIRKMETKIYWSVTFHGSLILYLLENTRISMRLKYFPDAKLI